MRNLLTLGDLVYVSYPLVPLRWLCAIARLQGTIRHLTRRRQAAGVRDNLAEANGQLREPELRAMTRRFFQYASLRSLLFILGPKLTDQAMARLFTVEGLERLDHARHTGRGVILLASHLNSLSVFLLVIRLRRRRYDIRTAVTEDRDNWSGSWFRSLFNRITHGRTYPEHIGAFQCRFNIRPMIQALAQGAIVLQTEGSRETGSQRWAAARRRGADRGFERAGAEQPGHR